MNKTATKAQVFSCIALVDDILRACLKRDWRAAKAEIEYAKENGATVKIEKNAEGVSICAARMGSGAIDVIICPDQRDANQIIESLRECGATIVEDANEPN